MTELIVRTEPIGGSPLTRAALEGGLGDWYTPRPGTPQEWSARVEAVRAGSVAKTWLDALRPALAATGAAAARLERVVAQRGVVVTTGQQPGLFGGPVYTWSKALSALALADEIEAQTGVAVAPIFWAANDDADFAEASWTAVARQGGADRLSVDAGAPLGEVRNGRDAVRRRWARVRRAASCLRRNGHPQPIEAARAAYRAGATVGDTYVTSCGPYSSRSASPS